MEKILALMIVVLVVGVSGKAQYLQASSTSPDNGKFLCHYCEDLVTFVHNMLTDKTFVDAAVKWSKESLCPLIFPVFKQYCDDYCDAIPGLLEDFAEDYLDPEKDCALVCRNPQSDLLNTNDIQNLAMEQGGAAK